MEQSPSGENRELARVAVVSIVVAGLVAGVCLLARADPEVTVARAVHPEEGSPPVPGRTRGTHRAVSRIPAGPAFETFESKYRGGSGVLELEIVDHAGVSVEDLPVRIAKDRGLPGIPVGPMDGPLLRTRTGSDGSVRVARLRLGHYVVEIGDETSEHGVQHRLVEVGRPPRRHRLVYDGLVRLVAVLTEVNGVPRTVDAVRLGGMPMSVVGPGIYELEIPLGRRRFELQAVFEGRVRRLEEPYLDTGCSPVWYRFGFGSPSEVTVRLSGCAAEEVEGARLEMRSLNRSGDVIVASVENATGSFRDVPLGQYCFALLGCDFGVMDPREPITCGAGGVGNVVIPVARAGSIRGVVEVERGWPRPRRVRVLAIARDNEDRKPRRAFPARMVASRWVSSGGVPLAPADYWSNPGNSREVALNAAGEFSVTGLPEGTYRLRVDDAGIVSRPIDVDVRVGKVEVVQILATAGAEISGRANTQLLLLRGARGEFGIGVTGTRFHAVVPHGEYRVLLSGRGDALDVGAIQLRPGSYRFLDLRNRGGVLVRVAWPYAKSAEYRCRVFGVVGVFRDGIAEMRLPAVPRGVDRDVLIRLTASAVSHSVRCRFERRGDRLSAWVPIPGARVRVTGLARRDAVVITSRRPVQKTKQRRRGSTAVSTLVRGADGATYDVFAGRCRVQLNSDSEGRVWEAELRDGQVVELAKGQMAALGRIDVVVRDGRGVAPGRILAIASWRGKQRVGGSRAAIIAGGVGRVMAPIGADVSVSLTAPVEDEYAQRWLRRQRVHQRVRVTAATQRVTFEVGRLDRPLFRATR